MLGCSSTWSSCSSAAWPGRRPLGIVVAELILASHCFEKSWCPFLFHSLNRRIDSRRISGLRRWDARAHPGLRKEMQLSSRDLPIRCDWLAPCLRNSVDVASGRNRPSHEYQVSHARRPRIARLRRLLCDLRQSNVPVFDAHSLRIP